MDPPIEDLACALDVDLQEDVAPRGPVRMRRAVEVLEELGGLEEPARCPVRFEGISIDEHVGVVGFSGTLGARRP
jgi:hypothetical protein